MTRELQAYEESGLNLYCILINSSGRVFNVSSLAFETFTMANWLEYGITLFDIGTGLYMGDLPSGCNETVTYVVYSMAGSEWAVTDEVQGSGVLDCASLPISL